MRSIALGLMILLNVSFICAQTNRIERDPFSGPTGGAQTFGPSSGINVSSPIKVSGIIWDEESPLAIVIYQEKKKIIGINDIVDGKKVINITRNSVLLKSGAKTLILNVGKESSMLSN